MLGAREDQYRVCVCAFQQLDHQFRFQMLRARVERVGHGLGGRVEVNLDPLWVAQSVFGKLHELRSECGRKQHAVPLARQVR